MKTINVTLTDQQVLRKETLKDKKTWPCIVENGLKTYEDEQTTQEPLGYLKREKLQLNIMRNIEKRIWDLSKNNSLRREWDMRTNWMRVQMFLNDNTSKAGSTSSTQQCSFLGVDPDGKTFF